MQKCKREEQIGMADIGHNTRRKDKADEQEGRRMLQADGWLSAPSSGRS